MGKVGMQMHHTTALASVLALAAGTNLLVPTPT